MARDCQGAAEVIGVFLTGGRLDHMIGQPSLDVLAEGLPSPRVEIPSPQLSRLRNLHEQLCAQEISELRETGHQPGRHHPAFTYHG